MAINLGAKKEDFSKVRVNMSKTLTPRNEVVTITGVTCRENNYNNQEGYDVALVVEGADITDQGFEGFFIDKDNESLGRHKGPVGNVKLSRFSFATKTFVGKNGKPDQTVDRDTSIVNEFIKICKLLGKEKFEEMFEGSVPDVPSLIAKANIVLKGCQLNMTIAGSEYESNGYTKYDLFLPKAEKGFYAIEAVGTNPSNLQAFDPNVHIIKKKTSPAVDSFEPVESEFSV